MRPRGELRAELRDAEGKPLPGFSFLDCIPIKQNDTNCEVRWRDASPGPLAPLAGRPVRLAWRGGSARLFAFQALSR